MANEIHNYSIERFAFGDDDYYDIDWYDGAIYRTAKIKGSVIKAGILASVTNENIYNSDGTISGNRTIDADGNFLTFDNVANLRFNTFGAPFGVSGFEINADPTGNLFTVKNSTSNTVILKVSQDRVQINQEYTLPVTDGTAGQVITTDGAGNTNFQDLQLLAYKNNGSNQWSVVAPATTLPTGQIANGFSFFTEANKVVAGTTSYDEYFLSWGRKLTLTGTNGTANINILGVNYLATFNTNLTLTASNFVTTHQATLNGLGIQVFAIAGVLRFGSITQSNLTTITITTLTGNLNGTFDTAINDHVVIPYTGRPYAGERLEHRIRVNFNIDVGNEQYYALSLRRWQDDSVIGSIIQVTRNTTLTGQQKTFLSYTSGATDPFVTGGFYFALENQSGQSVTISGSAGILIQTSYQNPTKF